MTTAFSKLLARATGGSGALTLSVPDDWTQGRTVFGGLQVAAVLRAMRALVPETPLRTIQATFFAPATTELRIESRIVRTGKSTTHVEGRILDGDATAALVIAVFGAPRASAVSVAPAMPAIETRPDAPKVPFIPGLVPNFTQHFDVRYLRGSFPFSGDTSCEHVLDVSMLDDADVTQEHVVAMADFVPPLALSHLTAPAMGSTLTWMLELVADVERLPPRGFRVDATLMAARDGYTSQSSILWSPTGKPVALSRQSMLVFG